MILRRELPADRNAVLAVHRAAFGQPGGGGAGAPVEAAEARLVRELHTGGSVIPGLSLVAMAGDEIAGHVVCSRGSIDGRPAAGLGPLGVLPAHQRRGVGLALMHGVLAAADALNEPAVLLLGNPGYYRRFGFRPAQNLRVLPPDPEWGEYFQIRPLTAWDRTLRGTFRYAPAFDRL
jgi:putative acetyltransferase